MVLSTELPNPAPEVASRALAQCDACSYIPREIAGAAAGTGKASENFL